MSAGGFAAKFIESTDRTFNFPFKLKDVLELEFPLPGFKRPLPATGIIEWHNTEKKSGRIIHSLEIGFKKLDFHDKLDLLSFGLHKARKRQTLRVIGISLVTLFILILATLSLGLSDKQIRKKLIVSEANRMMLEQEVKIFDKARERLKIDLERMTKDKAKNRKIIDLQNASIKRMNADIAERQDRIKFLQYLLNDASDEFHLGSSDRAHYG